MEKSGGKRFSSAVQSRLSEDQPALGPWVRDFVKPAVFPLSTTFSEKVVDLEGNLDRPLKDFLKLPPHVLTMGELRSINNYEHKNCTQI